VQTLNLFDAGVISNGQDARTARLVRTGQRLYQVTRHGAKIDPALVWMDAGLAVVDAFSAYARYRQASEITQTLEAECKKLRHLLENESTILGLELDTLRQDGEQRMQTLEDHFAHNRDAARRLLGRLVAQRALIDDILDQLCVLRGTQNTSLPAFVKLESAAHQLMRAHLACLLDNLSD